MSSCTKNQNHISYRLRTNYNVNCILTRNLNNIENYQTLKNICSIYIVNISVSLQLSIVFLIADAGKHIRLINIQ